MSRTPSIITRLPIAPAFWLPLVLVATTGMGALFHLFGFQRVGLMSLLFGIVLGSGYLVKDLVKGIAAREAALDIIALTALVLGLYLREWWVASVLLIMYTGGRSLEEWAALKAKKSLSLLTSRIPQTATEWRNGTTAGEIALRHIKTGMKIHVASGEVIPLDGVLVENPTQIDESSLTGEAMPVDKLEGDGVFSGTIVVGQRAVIKITQPQQQSRYQQIVSLVEKAQADKPPLVRMANRYAVWFTAVTALFAIAAYAWSGSLEGVLAVLVIATPCPLILAAPIGMVGGMSSFARRGIIIKRLSALEQLASLQALLIDKTGTLTMGSPVLKDVSLYKGISKGQALAIAAAIERHSLHPIAKTIVEESSLLKVPRLQADKITEKAGQGISGTIGKVRYHLFAHRGQEGSIGVSLKQGGRLLAVFRFTDEIKKDSVKVVRALIGQGVGVGVYTGDMAANTQALAGVLPDEVLIHTQASPEDKMRGIHTLKKQGQMVGMIGDGINDAPALAAADVGIVFAHEEQTAATEAADVVIMTHNFMAVSESIDVASKSIGIVKGSMMMGIGLSMMGMGGAVFGLVPPLLGVLLQELIDVISILNSLRTSKL